VVEEQRRFVAEASANCSWLVCSIFWLNLSSLLLTDSEEKREARWSRREETRQRPSRERGGKREKSEERERKRASEREQQSMLSSRKKSEKEVSFRSRR
jgi:hypothetical protein